MGENNLTNVSEKKPIFTVKNVLRVFSLLCLIFVFCPSFLVSCSGQTMDVSVMTAVGGVSMYGEKVVDPHPIMLICLLIPIAVLVLLFLKKFTDNKTALIILVCSAVDLVTWLIFRSSVKKIAEENYCSFETTGWFVANCIVLVLILLLSALVVVKIVRLDAELVTIFSGGRTQGVLNQMSATMKQMSNTVTQIAGNVTANNSNKSNNSNKPQKENAIGFCAKCGSPIAYGCKFCASCGTPVPESMIAEAEAARKAVEEAAKKEAEERARLEEEKARIAEEARKEEAERQAATADQTAQVMQNNTGKPAFCQHCGAELVADAAFCKSCGAKVE